MARGRRFGIDRFGIGLFIQDGAYTTVAAAVSILLVLTLAFSSATAVWTLSRSGDVQVAADAAALAGENVVSSYRTAATVVDAAVLSMGLAGFGIAGAGLVGLLVPGAQAKAAQMIDTGLDVIEFRNDFARSASRGLQRLERAIPFAIAANATRTAAAQGTERVAYTGSAIAVPQESASEFPGIEEDGIDTKPLEQAADELGAVADELERASQETAAAKRRAWLADCGSDGANMQERAASLTGLGAAENPDYASSITWEPQVGLDRARAYYRWRLDNNRAEDSSTEAAADAVAREAFYAYAVDQLSRARIEEVGGRVVVDLPRLPGNTAEARATSLYTDARWPTTAEEGGRTLHYSLSCPGAAGAPAGNASVAQVEVGGVMECDTCRFGVGDLGKMPAASTSIDNGFEYHLRAFTEALEEYARARNRELELERKAQSQAALAGDAFEEAIEKIAVARPRIAPPGRYGCIALVTAAEVSTPGELENAFAPGTTVPARGAMAAAVLAPDEATAHNNVLASFFSTLEERAGGGATGIIGDVMELWGALLMSYGDVSEGLGEAMDGLLGTLDGFGLGPVATWLSDRVDAVVRGLGFEPVDLRVMKPVLTDSGNVLARTGGTGISDLQEALRSLPVGSTDPEAILEAVGYAIEERLSEATFTIAEIPLPGGGSIPLTITLGELL